MEEIKYFTAKEVEQIALHYDFELTSQELLRLLHIANYELEQAPAYCDRYEIIEMSLNKLF
jgi:hypothetical protein